MAIPIAPTPFLTGKSAERFDRIMKKNEKKPKEKLVMPPTDWDKIHQIRLEILKERGLIK